LPVQDRGPAAYIAEFVGTLLLVFFITAAVSIYVAEPTRLNPTPFTDFTVIGLVHLFALFVLIQTLAVVSGAHLNPAVTTAMTFLRQIKPSDAGIYVIAQLAGGIAGAFLTKALLLDAGRADNYGAPAVSDTINGSTLGGMVIEGMGTFFLLWAIIGVAVNPRATREWAALAIGGALGVAVLVFAPATGGSFNPARAIGPALASGEWGGFGKFLLVYVLGPLIGAVVAVLLYLQILSEPGAKGVGGAEPVG
jgi:glycerol uptake facilitator protein